MTTTIAQAEELRDEIAAALGDLVDLVTLDGRGVKPQTRAAIVLFAPRVKFTSFTERDTVFQFAAVAGPASNPFEAWRKLDAILDRLEAAGINLETAEPASFDIAGSGTLPAYEITLNPL